MKRIVLSGHITVPDQELQAVREELPVHIAATKAEPGCLVFRVEEDPNQPGRFEVYEEFVSREAFDAHQERVRASDWGQISKNAERSYSIEEREE